MWRKWDKDDPELLAQRGKMILVHTKNGRVQKQSIIIMATWYEKEQAWGMRLSAAADEAGFVEWAPMPETFTVEELDVESRIALSTGLPFAQIARVIDEYKRHSGEA